MPFPLLLAAGIASAGKIGLGLLQNAKANKIHPQWQQYQANPLAAQQLGTAQNAYNGRMGGAVQEEQNIFNNQANTQASVDRNATDSGTALAMAAAGQGSTNDALNKLGIQEAQNKYNLLGNLNQAYGTNIAEGDKVYNSMLQKYQMDSGAQQQLRSSAFNNIFGGANDFITAGILGGGGAADGTLKNVLGFGQRNGKASPVTAYQGLPSSNGIPQQLPLNNFMPGIALQPNQVPMQGAASSPNYSNFNWLGK